MLDQANTTLFHLSRIHLGHATKRKSCELFRATAPYPHPRPAPCSRPVTRNVNFIRNAEQVRNSSRACSHSRDSVSLDIDWRSWSYPKTEWQLLRNARCDGISKIFVNLSFWEKKIVHGLWIEENNNEEASGQDLGWIESIIVKEIYMPIEGIFYKEYIYGSIRKRLSWKIYGRIKKNITVDPLKLFILCSRK